MVMTSEFLDAFFHNETIFSINWKGNRMGNDVALLFFQVYCKMARDKKRSVLPSIELSANRLTSDLVPSLLVLFKTLPSHGIYALDLSQNLFQPDDVASLNNVLCNKVLHCHIDSIYKQNYTEPCDGVTLT